MSEMYGEMNDKNISERKLTGTTSASHSVISTLETTINALTTYTVIVTAKDSSDVNIGHGGDTFLIQISNK